MQLIQSEDQFTQYQEWNMNKRVISKRQNIWMYFFGKEGPQSDYWILLGFLSLLNSSKNIPPCSLLVLLFLQKNLFNLQDIFLVCIVCIPISTWPPLLDKHPPPLLLWRERHPISTWFYHRDMLNLIWPSWFA